MKNKWTMRAGFNWAMKHLAQLYMLALGSIRVNIHQPEKKNSIVKFYTLLCYQNLGVYDTETLTYNGVCDSSA